MNEKSPSLMPDWETILIDIIEEQSHQRQLEMMIKARDRFTKEVREQTIADVLERLKLRIRKNLKGMDVINYDSWYSAETLSEADIEEEIKNLKVKND